MADTPPPVDFDDDVDVPESDEEPEISPFADPETSAMDEISNEPAATATVNLESDAESDGEDELESNLPKLPANTNVDNLGGSYPLDSGVETAQPPTIEARMADEPEPVQPVPLVNDNQGLFDDEESSPASKPTEEVKELYPLTSHTPFTPSHLTHPLIRTPNTHVHTCTYINQTHTTRVHTHTTHVYTHMQSSEEVEELESGDTFELDIKVSNPEKIGTGMSVYIAYTVSSTTTMPQFKNPENSVKRRFSDFLGLHQRLMDKHLANGRIIPPAPEKSMMGKDSHFSPVLVSKF